MIIRYDRATRTFAATDDDNVSRSNTLGKEKRDYIVIYQNPKTGMPNQKKLKAETSLDAVQQLRKFRFGGLGFYSPRRIKAFQYPEQENLASDYRDQIEEDVPRDGLKKKILG